MAITKNMAYDNPAYVAVLPIALGGGAGATSTTRFNVWTTMLLKSVTINPGVAGTSTNAVFSLVRISDTRAAAGTDTIALSTTTTLLATFTNLQSVAKNINTGTSTTMSTFTAGDIFWIAQATDATINFTASAEMVILPGASVSP
jgi:hypothetical protein